MGKTANKRKRKQFDSDYAANVSLYMFIVIHFALTVSLLVARNDLPLLLFYRLQHKISLPPPQKKSQMNICVPVFDAFSIVAAQHSFEMCFA